MDIIKMETTKKLWSKSFIVLTLSYLLLFMCLQMLLSPFPSYAKDQFHPDDFTISLVTSLFALSAIATRFAVVPLMRILHRNILLFCGLFLVAASTALYSFAESIEVLLILRIVFGVGLGMSSTIMPTLVTQIIPREKLGEGIGYFGLSTSLAMSIGPMVGLSILDGWGFRTLTWLGTGFAVLIIPLLLISRSIPPQPVRTSKPTAGNPTGRTKFYTWKVLLPASLNAMLSITYGGLLGFLALYGKEIHLPQIGLFFLFNAVTVLVIRPISGRIFDNKGPAAVLIPAAFMIIASLITLSFTHTTGLLIVAALLYGLGFGAIQPSTQAWMLRESSPEHHGAANSLFYNSIDFGVAFGSMLLGVIASHSSYAMMYRWSACVMIIFLVIVIGARWLSNTDKGQGQEVTISEN